MLAKRLSERGDRLVSWETLAANPESRDVVVLWDFASFRQLPRSIQYARFHRVSWSLESPLVAHRAYHQASRIASESQQMLGFSGVRDLLPASLQARFSPLHYPNERPGLDADIPWSNRGLAVMINSNKSTARLLTRGSGWPLKARARIAASAGIAATYPIRRTWHVKDFYRVRLDLIKDLGRSGDFSLFGVGWDRTHGDAHGHDDLVRTCYKGRVDDKYETLRHFRFAMCLENTAFPGYITEKVFDAMFAGCIPIYLGAPDVEHYIPNEAFIDLRMFRNNAELLEALRSMRDDEAITRRHAIEQFLESEAFGPFRPDAFVAQFLDAIDQVRRQ
jgi:hypothetical protein